MKIVVDTNILFSFFWKNSLTRKLLITSNLELISSEKAIIEINKYKEDIIKKAKIKELEFDTLLKELSSIVEIIDKKAYTSSLEEAKKVSPDVGDIEFIALCLLNSCPLWSNDIALKKQDKIKVLNTNEIIDVFV